MNAGSTLRAIGVHPHKTSLRLAVAFALPFAALATVLVAGCGGQSTSGSASTEITVFAGASLVDAFTKIGDQFTAAHPDVKVRFSFAGGPDLVTQVRQGAPADVLATGDLVNMHKVADLVGEPQAFARNQVEIVVEPGNPEGVTSLRDLADPDLKVVLGAPAISVGQVTTKVLAAQGVSVDAVSLEDNVKGVVTKVALGEADAGIAWVTDVSAAAGKVGAVQIPDAENATSTYPIAVVESSKNARDAQAFVDYVLSDAGQQVLRAYGFMPPSGP
jgi:molybdate transport system substrate-binding protein